MNTKLSVPETTEQITYHENNDRRAPHYSYVLDHIIHNPGAWFIK